MQHPNITAKQKPAATPETFPMPLNDYLLVLRPHADLCQSIKDLQQHFAKTFDCPSALHYTPQISLLQFQHMAISEHHIRKQLREILSRATPFQIKLDGFGSLPTHTIYIQVQTKNSIEDVQQLLRPMQPLLHINATIKAHFIAAPYITLARQLQPWQYEKGWLQYRNTAFSGSFIATEALLLKRSAGQKKYTRLDSFPLEAKLMPTVATQTTLF
jgi:2'-5' RNA ligase